MPKHDDLAELLATAIEKNAEAKAFLASKESAAAAVVVAETGLREAQAASVAAERDYDVAQHALTEAVDRVRASL